MGLDNGYQVAAVSLPPHLFPLLDSNPFYSKARSLFPPLLTLCYLWARTSGLCNPGRDATALSLSAGLSLIPGPKGKPASVTATWGRRVHACAPPPRSALETRVQALETQQQAELASLRGEKERLRRLLGRQSGALAGLERSLRAASSNSSLLQRQQSQLLESVQRLVRVVAQGPGEQRGPARCGRRGGEGWETPLTLPVHASPGSYLGKDHPPPPPMKQE